MKGIFTLMFICILAASISAQTPDGSAPKPIGPYSKARMAQGFLFISGQIAINPITNEFVKSDFRQEVIQTMNNLKAILEENGMSFNQVVKCTVYLTDMLNYQVFNEVYASYFNLDMLPVREVVQVVKLPKNAHVEISAIAAP